MKLGELKYDNLFAGDAEVITEEAKVKADTIVRALTLVSIDKNGYVTEIESAEIPEGQSLYGISMIDSSPIGEDGKIVLALSGEFNQDAIKYPEGTTFKDFKIELRNLNIFLKELIEG